MAETNSKPAAKPAVAKASVAKPAPTKKPAAKKVAAPKKAAAPKKEVAPKKAAAPKKTAAAKKPADKPRKISPQERYRMVEVAAYFIAERNSFADSPVGYWIEAEVQISKMSGK